MNPTSSQHSSEHQNRSIHNKTTPSPTQSPESSASPIPIRRSTPHQSSQAIPNIIHSFIPSPSCSPIPTRSSHSKITHSRDHQILSPSTPSKKIKHDSSSTIGSLKPSNQMVQPEKPSNALPTRPRPVRIQRPIKKNNITCNNHQVTSTSETSAHPLDEDDFFNLSSHKPIQFVSKTLGLTQTSMGTRKSFASKSPTLHRSIEPSTQNQTLVYLDDDQSQDTDTSGIDSEQDSDELEKYNKSKSKSKKVTRNLPNWTKTGTIEVESSSDEEVEGLEDLKNQQVDRKPNKRDIKGKQSADKKNQSAPPPKSRSPTPPPPANELMIRKATKKLDLKSSKNYVDLARKQHIAEALRRKEEDELRNILQDADGPEIPENLKINFSYHHQQQQKKNEDNDGTIGINSAVTFHASMVLDPRIAPKISKELRDQYESPIVFQMNSDQKFQSVYLRFEQLCSIPTHQLVVTHDNIKLSPFVTPASVRIFSNATLKVYDSATWDYVSSLRRQRIQLSVNPEDGEEDITKGDTEEDSKTESSVDIEAGEGKNDNSKEACSQVITSDEQELMNITVRSQDKTSVELLVKPTTLIKSIVKIFLNEINFFGFDENFLKFKIKLQLDGLDLSLDSKVLDSDICDQDVLDFIFL